jgi:hypothetical protein
MALQQPKTHVPLCSEEGQKIFLEAITKPSMNSYWKLSQNHETQITPSYCGIASTVMVLNSIETTKPSRPFSSYMSTYPFFDQTNVFQTDEQKAFQATASKRGMAFKDLESFLGTFDGVNVKAIRALDTDKKTFFKEIKEALSSKNTYIILYYDRAKVNEEGSWHISPVGGYSANSESFLRMDVARVKYENAWIPADELWKSVNCGTPVIGYDGGIMIVSERDPKIKKEWKSKKPGNLMVMLIGFVLFVFTFGFFSGWATTKYLLK